MTKCERLCRAVNDSFAISLDHAFEQRFETKLETAWNLIAFTHVSARADDEPLTHEQTMFIEAWSRGYSCANNVAGATQHLLDRKSP